MGADFNDFARGRTDDELRAAADAARAWQPPRDSQDGPWHPDDPGFAPEDEAKPVKITATPFRWRDPSQIPRRQWLYGHHLLRAYVSCTVAPGAAGKSSLIIGDALAMATGRDLLGTPVYGGPLRVWIWNLEDPVEEMERRLAAACLHHGLVEADIDDRLFIDSGRQQALCIASTGPNGATVVEPVVAALIAELHRLKIDVLVVDPFVSCHEVPENDNGAIDRVVKAWGRVADATGCAIELVHHLRKLGPDAEATAEAARGAVALTAAARSVRVLNRMTKDDAEKAGLKTHKQHFRVGHDKENLAPASSKADWFEIVGVSLPNGPVVADVPMPGDSVGVVVPWRWPNPLDDLTAQDLYAVQQAISGAGCRKDPRSENWVGTTIAATLSIDLDEPSGLAKVKALIKTWLDSGALRVVEVRDEKRNKRQGVDVGAWST